MKQENSLAHEFVEFIPDVLEEGKIYVSIEHSTVIHKCCCGCGQEVVTPLSPTDWKLIFDGKTISLDPSIGNWSFACQSHYWIRKNKIQWAGRWSPEKVDSGRVRDRYAKQQYFDAPNAATDRVSTDAPPRLESGRSERAFWRKLKRLLS